MLPGSWSSYKGKQEHGKRAVCLLLGSRSTVAGESRWQHASAVLSGGCKRLQAEVAARLCLPLDTPASPIHPRLWFLLDLSSDLHLTVVVLVLYSWRKSRSLRGDSCADSSFSTPDRQSMDKSQRVDGCREDSVMNP